MPHLDIKRLKELLHYDKDTGHFTWKVNVGSRARAGNVAGAKMNGYISIKIDSKPYYAQRLAWFYMTGSWPVNIIDHKDRVRDNNIFTNLRDTTRSINGHNCKQNKNNTSGVKGVWYHSSANKWVAQIMVERKRKTLGYFINKEDAVKARKEAASELIKT